MLLAETLRALAPRPGGRYLDGTVGLGGHAAAVLDAAPGCEICGLDRDDQALALARERLRPYGGRAHLFHCRYSRFAEALTELGWDTVDGALLDIGVSSMQIDENERGFSFYGDGPLDMRMDQHSGELSAWHWVNRESFARLKECIATLGEEPQAGVLPGLLWKPGRKLPSTALPNWLPWWKKPIRQPGAPRPDGHPATRTFQALRMAVNDELGELNRFLEQILAWLPIGGRLVVIAFHSLEDRMVKLAMRRWAEGCRCPRTCRCASAVTSRKCACCTKTDPGRGRMNLP